MRFAIPLFIGKMRTLLSREDGQDLVEYALMVALVALAATAGMKTLASDLSSAFSSIGSSVSSSTGLHHDDY